MQKPSPFWDRQKDPDFITNFLMSLAKRSGYSVLGDSSPSWQPQVALLAQPEIVGTGMTMGRSASPGGTATADEAASRVFRLRRHSGDSCESLATGLD